MTQEKNVILTARDIVVEFDVRDKVLTAIRGVSLDLIEGEVLALVGESGSGKSVLTKTFTGMLEENGRVAQGTIDYRGQDLTKLKSNKDWEPIRGVKIATIFQDPFLMLKSVLMNTHSNIQEECVNGLLSLLRLLVDLISLSVMNQRQRLTLRFRHKSLIC